jgi:hypothetical protein
MIEFLAHMDITTSGQRNQFGMNGLCPFGAETIRALGIVPESGKNHQ